MTHLIVVCTVLVLQVAVVHVVHERLGQLKEWEQLVLAVLDPPYLIIICVLVKFFMFNSISLFYF